MADHLPVIVVELLLVFGGALAFGWWQLRDLAREKRRRDAAAPPPPQGTPAPPDPGRD